jgi:hypothetical protein
MKIDEFAKLFREETERLIKEIKESPTTKSFDGEYEWLNKELDMDFHSWLDEFSKEMFY